MTDILIQYKDGKVFHSYRNDGVDVVVLVRADGTVTTSRENPNVKLIIERFLSKR